MHRLTIIGLVLLLLTLPAVAQDDADAMLAGYRLGKFQATTSMLAHELTMLSALVDQTGIAGLTNESYAAGLITDDDLATGNMVLAYSIWRCQFMILPVCDGGLSSESFQHPALEEFKQPTMEILGELKVLADDFVENGDYVELAVFTEAIAAGEYVEDLLLLSGQAAVNAGE